MQGAGCWSCERWLKSTLSTSWIHRMMSHQLLHAWNPSSSASAWSRRCRWTSKKETWVARLKRLPFGPQLPWCNRQGAGQAKSFGRLSARLDASAWERLKAKAREWKVQPTAFLLTYFQDALDRSCTDSSFTLTATVTRRPPELQDCLGEFTNVALLHSDLKDLTESRESRANDLQKQIFQQIDLDQPTGLQIMRLWRQVRQEEVAVFFTCKP